MGVVKWGIINIYGRLPERDNKLGEGTNCNCCWLIKCVGECACVCVWLGHKQKPYVSRSTPARTHSQTELLTHPHQPPTLTPRHLSLTLAFVVSRNSKSATAHSLRLSRSPIARQCMCAIFCYTKRQKQKAPLEGVRVWVSSPRNENPHRQPTYTCSLLTVRVCVSVRLRESLAQCSCVRAYLCVRTWRYDVNDGISVSTFVRVRSAASSVFRFSGFRDFKISIRFDFGRSVCDPFASSIFSFRANDPTIRFR